MPAPQIRSERLDPQARAVLEVMDAQGAPPFGTLDPAEMRAARTEPMRVLGGESEPLPRVEELTIPGPGGPLGLRLYAPESGGKPSVLMFFHGGGFVLCNLDTHDTVCRALAKSSGWAVIAVDYRLAPEQKFPAAVDDCYEATKWVAANAEHLRLDPRRTAVAGDSAGGNLATVIAMRCRDAGGPALCGQLLLYPVTDLSSFDTESHRQLGGSYLLTREAMMWFTGHYLASGDQARDPEASPLLASNLSGLPPALIVTAEFDPLRDEGEAYGERLRKQGVPATVKRYPGMIHGFISMRGVIDAGQQAIIDAAKFMRSLGDTSETASA